MNETDDQLRSEIERCEARGEWGAWAVVVGLVLEIVLATANSLGYGTPAVENWGAVLADFAIALGVYAEIHFGRRASHANAELRTRSGERVAVANERAAEADRRTKEAEVKLEVLRRYAADRRLDKNLFLAALKGRSQLPVQIFFVTDLNNWECFQLSNQISLLLGEAGWKVDGPTALSVPAFDLEGSIPKAFSMGGHPHGVIIDVNNLEAHDRPGTAFHALSKALLDCLGAVYAQNDETVPSDTLRVVVAARH